MALDLDAIQARADAAMNLEGETDAYIVAARWSQAAKDVPALVAELRAARAVIEDIRHMELRSADMHDARCEDSTTKRCRCDCHGTRHGTATTAEDSSRPAGDDDDPGRPAGAKKSVAGACPVPPSGAPAADLSAPDVVAAGDVRGQTAADPDPTSPGAGSAPNLLDEGED